MFYSKRSLVHKEEAFLGVVLKSEKLLCHCSFRKEVMFEINVYK